ncbi:glycosyltransferase family 8 protein [Aaosphaeria arxii CBS 175.79]|uniref:Glycosyltransferase family 8 protein n=1 Tax=Aaosphaeria arxii CBS 175.79 TaxID=1450172 RepID=A0A6A5XGX4_9PLEO|nr:glycosyltransferase family 8 protein [Aaosphaeria arxii CBS 175.79]KAF2012438.1 glycosyltransferase family 8 protein [Aaosphaeria arxii CBS 175.79]
MAEAESRDSSGKYAYATLLTRPSYLAGAILLAYTLHEHSPSTPLVIIYTPETLPEDSVSALEAESRHTNTILYPVEHLRIPKVADEKDHSTGSMVAERFIDTWTKLRVFQLDDLALKHGWTKLCFLDADMMIFKDPSPAIFAPDIDLKDNELRTTHVCVCNLDHDAWAPAEWTPSNCAYTSLTQSTTSSLSSLAPVTPHHSTRGIFNTGTFVFRPTASISHLVISTFASTPTSKLLSYKFPDQDFLNEVFASSWRSLHWSTNALKTWRYWHQEMWSDDEVRALHYIVDKPWARRVAEDGVAGYKGLDGPTHSWWWAEHERWERARRGEGETEEIRCVGRYVASEGVDDEEGKEALRAVGGGAQDFAKKWKKGDDDGDGNGSGNEEKSHHEPQPSSTVDREGVEGGEQTFGNGPHGPVLRRPMVGERGHGRVVRGGFGRGARGSSYMADG